MRKAKILFKEEEAAILIQHDDGTFTFKYHDFWLSDNSKPSISLTLPKIKKEFQSKYLFAFFFNMLPEGTNKQVICKFNQIDLDDYFGLLTIATKNDSIGAVRAIKVEQ